MILDLEQRTAAWHEWRAGGIGGSDAPALMGCHVGGLTPDDILAEKLGRVRREVTFAMRRGQILESPALQALQAEVGVILRPACVQHDDEPWVRASLDGITFLGDAIAEVKCPKVVDHEIALAGVVPHHYWPQVQHCLFASGAELCWYASWSKAKRFGGPDRPSLAVVEVEPDPEYLAKLLAEEERFWQRVCAERAGQKLTA